MTTHSPPLIRLDWSAYSTLAICRSCDWRAAAWDRVGAWSRAVAHVREAHGDPAEIARCRDALYRAAIRAGAALPSADVDSSDEDPDHGTV